MDTRSIPTIWVIDDDQSIRWVLERALSNASFSVNLFETASSALTHFKRSTESDQPDLVITDLRMPGISGFEFVKQIRNLNSKIPVIVMTAYSDLDTTVDAYREGAFEYLTKPFDIEETISLVETALARSESAHSIPKTKFLANEITGESPAIKNIYRQIGKLSTAHENILIEGEFGTGKSLLASTIHQQSPRSNASFIQVNLASIPQETLSIALFGAVDPKAPGTGGIHTGFLSSANGGTLYLSKFEVLPIILQQRLANFLSTGYYYQSGDQNPVTSNVRMIVSTDLTSDTADYDKLLSRDFIQQINKNKFSLPPLRDRQEDITPLTNYFFQRIADAQSVPVKQIDASVFEHFNQLSWPGNILELKNTCESMHTATAGKRIKCEDFPGDSGNSFVNKVYRIDDWIKPLQLWAHQALREGDTNLFSQAAPEFEKALLECALEVSGGRKQKAARLLGWGRNTLTRKLQLLDLEDG